MAASASTARAGPRLLAAALLLGVLASAAHARKPLMRHHHEEDTARSIRPSGETDPVDDEEAGQQQHSLGEAMQGMRVDPAAANEWFEKEVMKGKREEQLRENPQESTAREFAAYAQDFKLMTKERPLALAPVLDLKRAGGAESLEDATRDAPAADGAGVNAPPDPNGTPPPSMGVSANAFGNYYANYTNVAANETKCVWLDWGDWGACSATCQTGSAVMRRKRQKRTTDVRKYGKYCTGPRSQLQKCNNAISCPTDPVYSTSVEPMRSKDWLGTCSVGDKVKCPDSQGFFSTSNTTCQGNMCCNATDGSGDTFTCPSAEAGFGGCNLPKKRDCLGGMSGDRVRLGMKDTDPDYNSDLTPPGTPQLGKLGVKGPSGIATCSAEVCTKGWKLKRNLPQNTRCDGSPCSEVECCDLVTPTKASKRGNSSNGTDDDENKTANETEEPEEKITSKQHKAIVASAVLSTACGASILGICLGRWMSRGGGDGKPPKEEGGEPPPEEEGVAEEGQEGAAGEMGEGEGAGEEGGEYAAGGGEESPHEESM